MTNESVEKAKADVEKVKANFGKSDVEKMVAYAKADIMRLLRKLWLM